MDLLQPELSAEFQHALADQAHKQWLASIDERIRSFSEHCKRSEGQRARWFMEHHRARIAKDLAVLNAGIDDEQLRRSFGFGVLWKRRADGWAPESVPAAQRMLNTFYGSMVHSLASREYPGALNAWRPE